MDKKEFHKQKGEVERSEARDLAAKISTSLFPGGSTAYEAFTAMVQPIHKSRKDGWLHLLMNDLVRREEDGLTSLKALSKNEEFVTIATKAIILAQQNHQKEKLEALRNIVLNSITWLSKNEPIFDWSHKFLMIVDQISPLHILLLKTFQYPVLEAKEKGVDFSDMVKATNAKVFFKLYPSLKNKSVLATQCWRELHSFGFVRSDNFNITSKTEDMGSLHTHGKLLPQTTDFGNKFLEMIESAE